MFNVVSWRSLRRGEHMSTLPFLPPPPPSGILCLQSWYAYHFLFFFKNLKRLKLSASRDARIALSRCWKVTSTSLQIPVNDTREAKVDSLKPLLRFTISTLKSFQKFVVLQCPSFAALTHTVAPSGLSHAEVFVSFSIPTTPSCFFNHFQQLNLCRVKTRFVSLRSAEWPRMTIQQQASRRTSWKQWSPTLDRAFHCHGFIPRAYLVHRKSGTLAPSPAASLHPLLDTIGRCHACQSDTEPQWGQSYVNRFESCYARLGQKAVGFVLLEFEIDVSLLAVMQK